MVDKILEIPTSSIITNANMHLPFLERDVAFFLKTASQLNSYQGLPLVHLDHSQHSHHWLLHLVIGLLLHTAF